MASMRRCFLVVLLLLLILVVVAYLASDRSRSMSIMMSRFIQVQSEHTLPPDHHNSTLLYKSNPQEVRPLVPGLEFRSYKDILLLESMSAVSAELAYYSFVETRHVLCTDNTHIGLSDSGWDVCLVGTYKPKQDCLVYSFGYKSESFHFENEMADRFGCHVRLFNPHIALSEFPENSRIDTYQIGLSEVDHTNDKNWAMRTMGSILRQYRETKHIIDYLKMDLDYSEWSVLGSMLADHSLTRVKQLGITIHTAEVNGATSSVEQLHRYWQLLQQLESIGFRRWYHHADRQGRYFSKRTELTRTCCYQMVYVNINHITGTYKLPDLVLSPVYTAPPPSTTTPRPVLPPVENIPGLTMLGDNPHEVTPDMTPQEAEVKFYKFLRTDTAVCDNHQRLGNIGDGGWDICMVTPFKPIDPCLVYSFGINNDWSFDDGISHRFGCTVRAFDPSMVLGDHKHSRLVWFYNMGIGGENKLNFQGWSVRTLSTILKTLGDSNATIDYLKIDIEYNEWDSFQAMFDENSLKNVKQFAFEIHTNELHNKQTSTVEHFVSYYKTLRKLELLGFRKWLHHSNPFGRYQSTRTGKQQTCCYELYYVNTNFMKRKYHER